MTAAKTSSGSKTANSATKSVEDTIAATKAQMDDAVRAGQETAVKTFEQAVATSKEQFEKAGAQFFEGFNEMADFQKANVDAMMAASTAWAKGFETMGRAWFGFAQSTMEQTVSTTKAMMTAKTLKEVVDLQSDYTRTTFDGFLAETTKMSDVTMKVANEAMQPLGDRMNAAVEKMSKPAAA